MYIDWNAIVHVPLIQPTTWDYVKYIFGHKPSNTPLMDLQDKQEKLLEKKDEFAFVHLDVTVVIRHQTELFRAL